jgi:ACS family sodium-dependent inorganic phosphate cotransporter-like MFS transporter 5
MIAVGFPDCTQKELAIVFMIVALGGMASRYSGFMVNHADIALPYAGTLFGISNMAASIPGFVAPLITKAITVNVSVRISSAALSACSGGDKV